MDSGAFDGGMFQAILSPKMEMVEEGGGFNIWVFGVLVTLKVLGNETTGSSYAVFEDLVPVGAGPPMHTHTREDESWYMLEGELIWKLGDREFHAKKGSFIHLPRLVPHTFANGFDKPARMLVSYAPGGFERWFLDVGTPAVGEYRDSPPAESVERRRKGVERMQEYGIITSVKNTPTK